MSTYTHVGVCVCVCVCVCACVCVCVCVCVWVCVCVCLPVCIEMHALKPNFISLFLFFLEERITRGGNPQIYQHKPKRIQKMSATFEIGVICAEVSYQARYVQQSHTVFKRMDNVFEGVTVAKEVADVNNFFTEDSEFRNYEEKRNYFWKIRRAAGCHVFTRDLLNVCHQLVNRGVILMHDGRRIVNFFAVNGCMDISDLEDIKLKARDPDSKQIYECSLYSTHHSRVQLSTFPQSVCELLSITAGKVNQLKSVADYCDMDENYFVPHWWVCFTLENHKAVHVDICGTAYNLFHYMKSLSGPEAPVYMTETQEFLILPQQHKETPHKLYMLLVGAQSSLLEKLPREFRPFITAEKINMEITPTDALLARSKESYLQDHGSIVNSVLHNCIQLSLSECQSILVKVSNIVKCPELNGQVLKAHSFTKDRIVIEQKNGRNVKLLPDKLEIVRKDNKKQVLTLHEMRTKVYEADHCITAGDIVVLQNLTKAVHLNDKEGTVIDNLDQQKAVMEHRFLVQLKTRDHISVARKNLKVIKRRQVNESKLEIIQKYISEDPAGIKFYQRVCATSNYSFTNITAPDVLPALEKVVSLEFALVVLGSPAQHRLFQVILELSKMPSFPAFRTFVQCFRSGITAKQHDKIIDSNPEFVWMIEKCHQYGILKRRT